MNVQVQPHVTTTQRHLPFECVALLLQGGGALGAYQAGVCEALSEAGIHPDWIAGISIGAINAAIIAGNPPNSRVDRLRAKNYEGYSKDYEFSRAGMEEHWRAGYHDARRTLRHREVLQRPSNHEGVFTFDLAVDGRE